MRVLGPFERKRILPFVAYTTMFAMGLFSNMKALMLTNVGRCGPAVLPAAHRVSHRVGVYESIVSERAFDRESDGSGVRGERVHLERYRREHRWKRGDVLVARVVAVARPCR